MNNGILHNFNPIYINDIEASFTSLCTSLRDYVTGKGIPFCYQKLGKKIWLSIEVSHYKSIIHHLGSQIVFFFLILSCPCQDIHAQMMNTAISILQGGIL